MITRELPREEWSRLEGTEVAPLVALAPHSIVAIIVVEDEDRIVGTWALLNLLHAEGVWIAPQQRNNGSVARRLLVAMREAVTARGKVGVLTGSDRPEVSALLERVGARSLPMTPYYWPVTAPQVTSDSTAQMIGERFHASLKAHEPLDHGDLPEHHAAIGDAIQLAETRGIDAAIQAYNVWAIRAGFAPITQAIQLGDKYRVDAGNKRFVISADGTCDSVESLCQPPQ